MLTALLIAALAAVIVSVVFRFFAPEYSAPAALITFIAVLLVQLGAL